MTRLPVRALGRAQGTFGLATSSPRGRAVLTPMFAALVYALGVLAWPPSGISEKTPAPRGELRIVDTDSDNCASITLNVMEHLRQMERLTTQPTSSCCTPRSRSTR